MAKAFVKPTCGLSTTVEATPVEMQRVQIAVESECAAIRKIAAELHEVNPFQEMSKRGGGSHILALGMQHCSHTSCPVPAAMIKAVEIAAGLDLPKEVVITFSKE